MRFRIRISNTTQPQDGAARRAQIEATLADYPNLGEDRLGELVRWFRHEASALDVGTIASNETLTEPYRRFRADHIDPLTGKDILNGLLFAGLAALIVMLIIWRAV